MDDKSLLLGIWIPGAGWLRAVDDYIVVADRARAREMAKNIGRGASVRYMDSNGAVNSVLEQLYLERERRALCHYFKNFFKHSVSS